jgi:hypothetical protein
MHYDLVDLDRKTFGKLTAETFNNLARKDSASHAVNQDILQQIVPNCADNLDGNRNREKDVVSRGRQLY